VFGNKISIGIVGLRPNSSSNGVVCVVSCTETL
jgi:hypothetical protein